MTRNDSCVPTTRYSMVSSVGMKSRRLLRVASWVSAALVSAGCGDDEAAELAGWRIDSIAAGTGFTCASGPSGVQCWGDNREGQLGDGTRQGTATPTRVAGVGAVLKVAAGAAHACALLSNQSVYCWGSNAHGQLGDGSMTSRATPVVVAGLGLVYDLAVGGGHTCACSTSGRVFCWGANTYGQLGDGTTTDRAMPTPVEGITGCRSLAAGREHTCHMTGFGGGAPSCWGRNARGQLGDGTTTDRPSPVRGAKRLFTVDRVAAGAEHTCVVGSADLWCWGRNDHGEVGDGTTQDRLAPTAIAREGSPSWGFAVGASHACVTLTTFVRDAMGVGQPVSSLRCWGRNAAGQLGDRTRTDRSTPTIAANVVSDANGDVRDLAAGADHTCALLQRSGEVRCRRNYLGGSDICVQDTISTLVCWGANTYGQFGDGTTTERIAPAVVRRWTHRPIP